MRRRRAGPQLWLIVAHRPESHTPSTRQKWGVAHSVGSAPHASLTAKLPQRHSTVPAVGHTFAVRVVRVSRRSPYTVDGRVRPLTTHTRGPERLAVRITSAAATASWSNRVRVRPLAGLTQLLTGRVRRDGQAHRQRPPGPAQRVRCVLTAVPLDTRVCASRPVINAEDTPLRGPRRHRPADPYDRRLDGPVVVPLGCHSPRLQPVWLPHA